MIVKQPYFLHKNLFSDDELKLISSTGEALEPQQAKTYDNGQKRNYRDSHISWIENINDTNWLYKKLISGINNVNSLDALGWKFNHSVMEKLQYTRYSKAQHYNWHSDQKAEPYTKMDMPELNGLIRKISFSVLLNDDYEGGEFEFAYGLPDSDNQIKTITISPKKGLTIIFPSYIIHRVKPVISGERRSLVGWICGKPFV
jgi:PKHD-type hydroxylase